MRIAIIARRAQGINGTGGMERAATEIAVGLHRLGHDIELVTATPAAEAAIDLPFRVTLLPPRQRMGIRGWWDYRPWVQAVADHVRANPPDFIVSFYGDVAALAPGSPPVMLFTYGLEWYVTPGVHGFGLKRTYGPLGLAAIRRANYLPTCGAVHLARLHRIARKQLRPDAEAVHLHNWMQPDAGPTPPRTEARAAFGLPDDAVVLGVVSRLARDKRLDVAVRAVHALRSEHPELHFLVAGSGPERGALEAAAEGDAGIHFLGRVDDTTARQILRASDATISAARTEYQLFTVVEALSLGIPVICADAESQEGLIKEGVTGFILPHASDDSMQRAIRRLLAMTPEGRAAMEAACLREVDHGYTLDDAVAAIDATARHAVEG